MRHPCIALASAVAVTLLATTAPAALAAPRSPDAPAPDTTDPAGVVSQERVDRAERRVVRTARSVARIKAELAVAGRQFDEAAVRAAQASEAYNGARWRLTQAERALTRARKQAEQARGSVEAQRDQVAALVARSYVAGGDVGALQAIADADGPRALMDRYAAYRGASTSLEATLQRFHAASSLAEAFEADARKAEHAQSVAAQEARTARDEAVAAAGRAREISEQVERRKDELVRELARVQGISVRLARQRQDDLARIEAERAAAAAAARAAAEKAAREAERAKRRAERETEPTPDPTRPEPNPDPKPDPKPDPEPDPEPRPDPRPPAPNGGAAAAIAFARAQLGEPYRWAAAGPDAWDCSGLTMAAWRAGGISLPHYSAAQYDAGTPIGVGELRPGDLVFWGSSDRPGSIYHVALYIGDGRIIHAPRTGRPVSIDSMYYWIAPNFFVRP